MSQTELRTKKKAKMKKVSLKFFIKETNSLIEPNNIRCDKNKKKKMSNNFYYNNFINIFLLEFILFILHNKNIFVTSSENYIIIKVDNIGEQQIFSDQYNLDKYKPFRIYVNDRIKILRGKKISLDIKPSTIKIEWLKTIPDFTYMFANIDSIKSIEINNLLNQASTNISYMFYNCWKLESAFFKGSENNDTQITDLTKMFYNCKSLSEVKFNFSYRADNISVSEMFYNCHNLKSVYLKPLSTMTVNNMTKMFYNCKLLQLTQPLIFDSPINFHVNMSYLFYNCNSLTSVVIRANNGNYINTNDISYMFYNCKMLTTITLQNLEFKKSIDMSYLFYNCQKLTTINWANNNIKDLSDSNFESMFYNCSSITSINLPFEGNNTNINMERMFYNCISLTSIVHPNTPVSYYPSNMREMFYNSKALTNINSFLENIKTYYTKDMSFLFYNCISLESLTLKFSNELTRNMRGMFLNCKKLNSLQLNEFGTNNAEIMWEMFKGCNELSSLSLVNFDTSKVTDMESMFEGCSKLTSLSLENFITSKVQYMNKMFRDCELLKTLNFGNIQTNSVGTMHQMFYNCKSLTYLNISSMVENGQSIAEMFDKTPDGFTFCIGEDENIPEIFKMLCNKNNTIRDCSSNCYGVDRVNIPEKKLCCPYVKYLNKCYEKCPPKTQDKYNNGICVNFTCNGNNTYYDYDQNNCTENISGYYVNSTEDKTIDKCHEDCIECKGGWSIKTTNCTICKNLKKYIYLGNCYYNCTPGFNASGHCRCFDTKCEQCSEESLEHDLCITCKENYFKKEIDETNVKGYINCYQDPENYYLKDKNKTNVNNFYKQCYETCKYCEHSGDYHNQYCLNCSDDYPFPIKKINDSLTTYNCYINCSYYYYFNETNIYKCTNELNCPNNFSKLIDGERECVKNCSALEKKKYEYQGKCYEQCPGDSFNLNETDYFCRITCPFEFPFEMVKQQVCVNNCTIMERHYKLCRTNYEGNRSSEVQDRLFNNLQDDIIETFDYHYVNEEISIVLEEKNNTYEILTTNKNESDSRTSELILGECEDKLREYYGIKNKSEPLYILKLDAHREGMQNPKVEYLVYYPLNHVRLEQLDLTICEGAEISLLFKANITGSEDLYNKNSGYYTDICYTYTSDDGTDIPLEIRQKLYADNNQSLCEEGCDLKKYHYDTGKAECSCNVKITTPLVSEIEIDKGSLYNFVDITKLINFDVMKCIDLFFNSDRIVGNLGFFVFIPTFIMLFVCIIIFYVKDYSLIKKQINDIVESKKNYDYIIRTGGNLNYIPVYLDYLKEKGSKLSSKLRNRSISNFKPTINNQKRPPTYKVKNKLTIKIKKKVGKKKSTTVRETNDQKNINIIQTNGNIDTIDIPNINNKILTQKNDIIDEDINDKKDINLNNTNNKNAPPKRPELIDNETTNNNAEYTSKKNIMETSANGQKNEHIDDGFYAEKVDQFRGKFSHKEKSEMKAVLKYTNSELNSMSYNEALINDHRTYMEFYFSLIKSKHLIITLFESRDYNSRIIKVYLIFFNFASAYAINGLFFDDDSMNKIYQQKGAFNFIQQLPQILYSNIIGYFFDSILSFLSLSEDDVINLRQERQIQFIDKKKDEVLSTLKIKFIFFFIISFLFLVLFWYYIGCFCAVYRNTQLHLFKDTLIGFASSMGYPLLICLIPPIFRIPALKRKSKTNELMFILSKIIQFF